MDAPVERELKGPPVEASAGLSVAAERAVRECRRTGRVLWSSWRLSPRLSHRSGSRVGWVVAAMRRRRRRRERGCCVEALMPPRLGARCCDGGGLAGLARSSDVRPTGRECPAIIATQSIPSPAIPPRRGSAYSALILLHLRVLQCSCPSCLDSSVSAVCRAPCVLCRPCAQVPEP